MISKKIVVPKRGIGHKFNQNSQFIENFQKGRAEFIPDKLTNIKLSFHIQHCKLLFENDACDETMWFQNDPRLQL